MKSNGYAHDGHHDVKEKIDEGDLDSWIDKALKLTREKDVNDKDKYDPSSNHLISAKEMWDGIDGFDDVVVPSPSPPSSTSFERNQTATTTIKNSINKHQYQHNASNSNGQGHDSRTAIKYNMSNSNLDNELLHFQKIVKEENEKERNQLKQNQSYELTADEMWVSDD